MYFRHKIWIILNEVNQIVRYHRIILKRNKDINISFFFRVLWFAIIFIICIVCYLYDFMSMPFKKFMNITIILLKNLLMDRLVWHHFNFETSTKLSLEIFWGIAFCHDSIFDYTNSIPNIVSLLNVLSGYEYRTLWVFCDLLNEHPYFLSWSQIKVRCRLI